MKESPFAHKGYEGPRTLSPDERRENMAGAFCAAPDKRAAVQGKRVLLIDDIFTTGATASECGRALREAGVSELYFAALLNAANRHHQQPDKLCVIWSPIRRPSITHYPKKTSISIYHDWYVLRDRRRAGRGRHMQHHFRNDLKCWFLLKFQTGSIYAIKL